MDPQVFDRWVAAAARRPSRRAALRLLTGGLLGAVLPNRAVRAAQLSDIDGDGLFDDDETFVYGTNPFAYDGDGDGVGDGEEVYYGTDPLVGASPAGCGAGLTFCDAVPGMAEAGCYDLATHKVHCGGCGGACFGDMECRGGVCSIACFPGQAVCGYNCVDLATDSSTCGACGNVCPTGTSCVGGCLRAELHLHPGRDRLRRLLRLPRLRLLQLRRLRPRLRARVRQLHRGRMPDLLRGVRRPLRLLHPPGNSCCDPLICISAEGGGYCSPRP